MVGPSCSHLTRVIGGEHDEIISIQKDFSCMSQGCGMCSKMINMLFILPDERRSSLRIYRKGFRVRLINDVNYEMRKSSLAFARLFIL
mmetsp:Transcript_6158/g.12750  ORF Transcript_6158/g.12750 Transcript_6158/m.12750 type:complete len:88 (+) Transcript_6158:1568-1831(+)